MSEQAPARFHRYWPILPVLAILTFAIRSESFWTDEVTIAWAAMQVPMRDFWAVIEKTGSEAQMPLFAILMWLWARLVGTSEIALRAFNLPWALIGLWAMARLLQRARIRPAALLLCSASFLGFYMNEARPYIMTFATSALALLGFDQLMRTDPVPRGARLLFPLGTLLCVGASMLNLCLLPALLLFDLIGRVGAVPARIRALLSRRRGSLLLTGAGVALLLIYYAHTLLSGHGGMKQPYAPTNLAFSIYEWLSLGGLGPSRHLLREIAPHAALRAYLPTLLPALLIWALLGVLAIGAGRRLLSDPWIRRPLAALMAGGGTLILLAIMAPASLWGRHFMFLAPFPALILGRMLLPTERQPWGRIRIALFVSILLLFVVSSVRQRVMGIYAKDPLREAVAELRKISATSSDLPIIWTGPFRAVEVYGGQEISPAEVGQPADPGRLPRVIGGRWAASGVATWASEHAEYILLLHRPDVLDPHGAWEAQIAQPRTELIWQRGNVRIYHVDSR